jgi:hypothetical protein
MWYLEFPSSSLSTHLKKTQANKGPQFNQYVNPIGLQHLAWKFYFVYIAILVLECLAIYFLYIETKGPTLEEIAMLFDGDDANVAGNEVVGSVHPTDHKVSSEHAEM